jgi:hypothetical protein
MTGGADTKQKDFVPFRNETRRNGFPLVQSATRYLEETVTERRPHDMGLRPSAEHPCFCQFCGSPESEFPSLIFVKGSLDTAQRKEVMKMNAKKMLAVVIAFVFVLAFTPMGFAGEEERVRIRRGLRFF